MSKVRSYDRPCRFPSLVPLAVGRRPAPRQQVSLNRLAQRLADNDWETPFPEPQVFPAQAVTELRATPVRQTREFAGPPGGEGTAAPRRASDSRSRAARARVSRSTLARPLAGLVALTVVSGGMMLGGVVLAIALAVALA